MSNPFEQPLKPPASNTEQDSLIGAENEAKMSDEEWTFHKYLRELELTPHELRGKRILDVGASDGRFAKYLREQSISSTVTSLDPKPDQDSTEEIIVGNAEALPLRNEEFDLVISASAIPNIYGGVEYAHQREQLIQRAIEEMLRVVRYGGEIRLGNVALDNDGEYYKQNYFKAVNIVLDKLSQRSDIVVEKIRIVEDGTYVVRVIKKVVKDANVKI